jgi:hypothetical protein
MHAAAGWCVRAVSRCNGFLKWLRGVRARVRACGRARRRAGPLTEAVVAGTLAVAALNALPALLGAFRWLRGEASHGFWILLRVGQGSALAIAIAVGSLAAAGHYSSEHLFYLYALLPLAVAFVAEQLRVASAQTILDHRDLPDAQAVGALPESEQRLVVAAIIAREMGVMTLSALVVVFLALRAASTAHGF